MARLQLYLVKDAAGSIRVHAKYDQTTPVLLERVNVIELDAGGSAIGAYTTLVRNYFGPGNGSDFVFSHTPSGVNVKQVKATGFYINIDQVPTSNTVTL